MNRIVVDLASLAKFGKLDQVLEFCDESGHFLGYFIPASDPALYDGVEAPESDEELDRIEKAGGGRALTEIMADLQRRQ